ncbi:septum formation initiator family protein [Finegoldia magna]|uniref:FtsB family cell division protein n=1 Tax=Finegoldia TaxID=150022 RepID=UPI000763BC16|nr:septum formation initiator family protein [Finegoldia magna]KXA07860.1 septum formation initiator [Finegoldia magna]MDU1213342.1 cell division protein FtsL [Finegoldia magna]MDU5441990.1 cell division protein FtsL [Finegoldia magna]MDU5742802.1 cell division protein FtsL [Finegoldia magna]MDU5970415.1 cell division protein FtsL [Finegoldia magna]
MNTRENQIRKRRKNVNKFRIIVSAITIFACITLLFTIFKQQIQIRNINNVKIEQQNKKAELEKEIVKLSDDTKNLDNPKLIEKYAREKLGMVKPNEILIKDEKEKPKKDSNFTPSPTLDKKSDK